MFTQHISRRFNKDLEELRTQVSNMGGLVERQLAQAIEAIVSGDSELGLAVAKRDFQVNQYEVEIDESCSRILATRAPAAADLRLIVAVIKVITDLERIGDEAQRVGICAARLAAEAQPRDRYDELKSLSEHVQDMLHDALDAFSRLDVDDGLSSEWVAAVIGSVVVDSDCSSVALIPCGNKYSRNSSFNQASPRLAVCVCCIGS